MNEGIDPNIILAIYRIVGQVEKRFDDLRTTDREAVELAHDLLSKRLEDYPQEFARKNELDETVRSVRRLENDALSREMYDQHRQAELQLIAGLDNDKLNRSVFDTFIENYRIEQQRAAAERRDVAEVLSQATDKVRAQVLEERGEYLTQEFYEQRHHSLVMQVDAIERWQYKLVGALVFATFVAPLITALIVFSITQGW